MKISSLIMLGTAALVCTSSAIAQAKKEIQLSAMIVKTNGERLTSRPVFVERILKNTLWYREKSVAVDIKKIKIDGQQAIYVARPGDFVAAVELYEGRKYELAIAAFKEIKTKYKNFSDINNSLVAQSELYELDCLRKLKQYDKLAEAEKIMSKSQWLTKTSHQQQIKIYKLWTMLRDKASHPRLIKEYTADWREVKLPNSLRAQVEFIYGKALESEGNVGEALIAYSKAMNADFAASEMLALEAATATFNLIEKDTESQAVRELWDKNEKDLISSKVNTAPYFRLLEAGAMVRVHNKLGLSGFNEDGSIIELPARFSKYLKYTKAEGEKFIAE